MDNTVEEDVRKAITALAKKTEKAGNNERGVEAMQLSQAALNLSHVLSTLDAIKRA